jgi:hypothetical protein
LSAIIAVARAELRRRWFALLLLGLIAGLTGGALVGVATLARRTDSAFERLQVASQPGDAVVTSFDRQWAADTLREIDVVEDQWDATYTVTQWRGDEVTYVGVVSGPPRPASILQPAVVSGRAPKDDAPDEVVMQEAVARSAGVHVGDVVELGLLTPDDVEAFVEGPPTPHGPDVQARVVGLVRIAALTDTYAPFIASPAFYETYARGIQGGDFVPVRLRGGAAAIDELTSELDAAASRLGLDERSSGFAPFTVARPSDAAQSAHSTARVLVGGLLFVGAVAAAAGVLALAQSFARHHASTSAEQEVEAALGFTRWQRTLARLLPSAFAASLAAGLTIAGGLVSGAVEPMGGIRRLEPSPGWAPNAVCIALGVVAVVALLAAVSAVTAAVAGRRRPRRPLRAGTIAERLAALGARPPEVVGIRMAIEAGRGRSAVPVRSAIAGALIGVLGVVGSLTFASSLHRLVDSTARWGGNLDFTIVDAHPELFDHLAADERLDDVSSVVSGPVAIGSRLIDAYGIEAVEGDLLTWTMFDGRLPTADDDLVIGSRLADQLDVGVGGTVDITTRAGAERFEVVGVGIGLSTNGEQLGVNVLLEPGVLRDISVTEELFTEAFLTVAPGADVAAVTDEYAQDFELFRREPPVEIRNLDELGSLPGVLAAFLAAVGLLALGNGLVSAVRRRLRDIGVLRTMGFTPLQAARTVLTMSTTTAIAALVLGIVLGVATGSVVWGWVAGNEHLQTDSAVPWAGLGLTVPAALVAALAVAALPARRAATVGLAAALRAE